MNKKKHLQFYYDCMATGRLPFLNGSFSLKGGLCQAAECFLIDGELLDLFQPSIDEVSKLENLHMAAGFWGSEMTIEEVFKNPDDCYYAFTPLRQTVVLFMAAMNGEL